MQYKNKDKTNPTSKDFGASMHTPTKVLKEAKQANRGKRVMRKVFDARRYPDRESIDLGVCWMCWMDLTEEPLEKWRREPYSFVIPHDQVCPLCGYMHWKGRIWYPFRFIRGYIGNPSSRHGIRGRK